MNEENKYYGEIAEILSSIIDKKYWTDDDLDKLENCFLAYFNSGN